MKITTIDFETYYSKDFSLTKLTTEAYVRNEQFEVIGVGVKENESPARWYSFDNKESYKQLLRPYMDGVVVAHNAAFDGLILNHHFGLKPKFWIDTLSMARPIHGLTSGASLRALAEAYGIGIKGTEVVNALGKKLKDFTASQLADYGKYCCNDVELTYKLFNILYPEIPKHELQIIDLMIRMFTEPVLIFNQTLLEDHLRSVCNNKQKLLEFVSQHCDGDDLMSNPKFAEVLRKLGVIPPIKINAKGKETFAFAKTDAEFKALLEHPDERVQAVVSARLGIKSTLEETRTEAFIGIANRGPLPILLNYYGAHTGRASGGDKINLQNLPRGGVLRKSICAPDGHMLVACDSSQIEARVTAWLAGEEQLLKSFANNEDIYSRFAEKIYGYKVSKDTHKTERFVGKTCILGLGYGMGAKKFQATLKSGNPPVEMDIEKCEYIVGLYRETYPAIKSLWYGGYNMLRWMMDNEESAKGITFGPNDILVVEKNRIKLPNGMYIRYPGLKFDGNEIYYLNKNEKIKIYGGKVIENIVQALARIIVFEQMLTISKKYKVVLTVHDEVVVSVPEDEALEAKDFVFATMCTPLPWCENLPLSAEAKIGKSYGDTK